MLRPDDRATKLFALIGTQVDCVLQIVWEQKPANSLITFSGARAMNDKGFACDKLSDQFSMGHRPGPEREIKAARKYHEYDQPAR
jgi:hypothetical protein